MKKVICSMVVVVSIFVYGFAIAAPNNPPSAPVTVVNTDSNPVPVTNVAKSVPFQTGFKCDNNDIGNSCSALSDKEIPEGMRLVVEYVSARILVTPGNAVEVYFTVGDPTAEYGLREFRVPANYAGEIISGTLSIYSVSEKVLVYADRTPTRPNIVMSLYSPYPAAEPDVQIQEGLLTGYLVPLPQHK